ncbi:MAG: DUF4864 domain-containing protein [Paracoccaceae bacterium]
MRFLRGFLIALALAFPAVAQEQPIQDTIRGQIEAFQTDDLTGAFAFASPNIKTIFGTPETFGQMVQRGYPMVYNPSDLRMGELREVAGALWQRIYVTDAEGRGHALDYQMVETPEGWKINAVQLLQGDDVGV